MSEAVRLTILKRLCKVVDDDAWAEDPLHKPGNREVIAASRTLIAADTLNLARERTDLVRARFERAAGGGGMAEVHERMKAYADADPDDPGPDGNPGEGPGVVPAPA